jgi:hypothetical protein
LHKAALIDRPRVQIGDPVIYNPDYQHISSVLARGAISGVTITEGVTTSYSEYDKVFKMDGLKLKATLTLGGEEETFETYNVSTNSLPLTNTEVIDAIVEASNTLSSGSKESTMFEIYDVATGTDLGGYIVYGSAAAQQSNTEQVTHIDASQLAGTVLSMRILSSQSLERATIPGLLINKGKLAGSVTNIAGAAGPVFAFNGSDNYAPNPVTTSSIFGWQSIDSASKDIILTVDLAQMKQYVESGETGAVGFCIKQTLTINKYGGTEKFTTISRQFVIDNIAAVNTEEEVTEASE